MKTRSAGFIFVLILAIAGCANQWREGDAQISGADVMTRLDNIQTSQAQSAGSSSLMSQVLQMKDDPSTAIYFADAPGPMGPVASVLSFTTYDFLGADPSVWYGDISQGEVYFMDELTSSGHQAGLIVGIQSSSASQLTYSALSGPADISNGEYTATLSDSSGHTIVLHSFDIQSGDLASVIQLKVYEVDSGGNENYIGKFSTLVGFGG